MVTASATSQPFGLAPEASGWMNVRVDGDGHVSTIDSSRLVARRSRAGATAAAGGFTLLLILLRHR